MIKQESTTLEWIERVAKSQKADKILVEKVIRALILLEGLAESSLSFVFKGGTALMLLLDSNRRLSIDIDIIVPEKHADMSTILKDICSKKDFTKFEEVNRNANTQIIKSHYKLFFNSVVEHKESHILLDVLWEDIHYENVIEKDIQSTFTIHEGSNLKVTIPDYNNILADKLTAFAPNTTGIPYTKGNDNKEMGMEIIKQMYDIGCLFEYADNPNAIAIVFKRFVETEVTYRNKEYTYIDVLDDIIENALSICIRGAIGNTNYAILFKGITRVKSFIFSENFHLERAITFAAKAAYIAGVIKYGSSGFIRFDNKIDMTKWQIAPPMDSKFNKLKKSNPEAFFYLVQLSKLT